MAKLNYVKLRGAAAIDKKTHKADSVADPRYRALHEVAYKNIQKRNSEYAAAEMRAAVIKISSDSSTGQMNPEIQHAIDTLRKIGAENNIPEETGGINIYEQIFPACLVVSEQPEPKAQRLFPRKDGDLISVKASNVIPTFNASRMLHIALELVTIGSSIADGDVFTIIQNIYFLISNFYKMLVIKLDEISTKILLTLHECGHPGFTIDEQQLMEKVQERYPEISEERFHEGVDRLIHFSCVKMEFGNLSIIETM